MDTVLNETQAGGAFQVHLPANFLPAQGLHEHATLQVADEKNGFFVIGLREDKDDLKAMRLRYTLQDYSWFVERKLSEGLDTLEVNRHGLIDINGLNGDRFDFHAMQDTKSGPLEVWMRACVIESPTAYYQLISWTSADLAHYMAPVMEQVECSFVELIPGKEGNEFQPGGAESVEI